MFDRMRAGLAFLVLLVAAQGIASSPAAAQPQAAAPRLSPFANEATLGAFLQSIVAEQRRRNMEDHGSPFPLPPPPPPPPPPPAPSAPGQPAALNITNN